MTSRIHAIAALSQGLERMNNIERGIRIARELFKLGDMPRDKTQRIEFKGGTWPEAETGLGGFCEHALAGWLAGVLERLDGESEEEKHG
jgi:hypothetical protein